MFGPDKCGDGAKVHLILRHRHGITGEVEEKHLASPPAPASTDYTHLYTLKIL
jgi:calnexin